MRDSTHANPPVRHLSARVVLAKSFARIHRSNLSNFGIVPLIFSDSKDWDKVTQGDILGFPKLKEELQKGDTVTVHNVTQGYQFKAKHTLSQRELENLLHGGLISKYRKEKT